MTRMESKTERILEGLVDVEIRQSLDCQGKDMKSKDIEGESNMDMSISQWFSQVLSTYPIVNITDLDSEKAVMVGLEQAYEQC